MAYVCYYELSMKRLAAFTLIILSVTMFTQPAAADTEACDQNLRTIPSEAVTVKAAGTYRVYVKLSLPGQTATITTYVGESCTLVGQAAANGDTWTEVGSAVLNADTSPSFEISGDIPGNNDAAAKPQLMLVPEQAPCTPNSYCDTTISDTHAYLTPIALTTSSSGLGVLEIMDPATDKVAKVEYYTDGQLMYATPGLQPFNLSYTDYYQQRIARVIVYTSGQRAVLEATVPAHADNLLNFAMRSYVRHSTLIIAAAITLGLIAILYTIHRISLHIDTRNYYNYTHGLGQHTPSKLETKVQAIAQNGTYQTIRLVVVITSIVVTLIISVNTFVLSPYKVDGTSMYATLQNGQLLAVNKLPVTLNRQFKPSRGQVIIFHPNYGNLAYSDLRVDNLLVKRIVALPGERITSNGGKLTVYNAAHPSGYVLEDTEPWGKKVTVQPEDSPFDFTLSDNQIFVAGDNRPDSIDSRINGVLPLSEVIGVVIGY